MLLKTIYTPNPILKTLDLDATFLSADETVDAVNKIREEWLEDKGILPVLSKERYVELYRDYEIYRVCPETKQIGDFAGDLKLPHNCVAVIIQNTPKDMPVEPIYITLDVEAYIISNTGVTVSVINGKKTVEGTVLKGNGHFSMTAGNSKITMEGENISIDTRHMNLANRSGKTGPAL